MNWIIIIDRVHDHIFIIFIAQWPNKPTDFISLLFLVEGMSRVQECWTPYPLRMQIMQLMCLRNQFAHPFSTMPMSGISTWMRTNWIYLRGFRISVSDSSLVYTNMITSMNNWWMNFVQSSSGSLFDFAGIHIFSPYYIMSNLTLVHLPT